MTDLRIGHGFDVHCFSDDPNRSLVLGGVTFAGKRGLAGHSDADVVAHSCIDAMLAAAGEADIGQLFPDSEPRWEGASGLALVAATASLLAANGWSLVNADCTVVADTPRLAPHREEMQSLLTEAAGGPVTVKGRRTEGVGALGRGEGIVAFAVALVERR